jgi:hypothetical protein
VFTPLRNRLQEETDLKSSVPGRSYGDLTMSPVSKTALKPFVDATATIGFLFLAIVSVLTGKVPASRLRTSSRS